MIVESDVDIFTCGYQTLVCPVNTVGVMGNGLARAFRDRVPGLFERYKEYCDTGLFAPHKLWSYSHPDIPYRTLCFPTKGDWKNPSNLDDIRITLLRLRTLREQLKIESLAIPALGCGKGELNRGDVRPLIYQTFKDAPYDVLMIPPRAPFQTPLL